MLMADPPRLDVPVFSDYRRLYSDFVAYNSLVLSLAAPGEMFLTEDPFAYEVVEPGQLKFYHPNNFYDVIVLNKVLETYPHPQRFKLLENLSELLEPGGVIVSLSAACYDACEVYILLNEYGLPLVEFENNRLLNKQILELQPDTIAFSEVTKTFPTKKELVSYIQGPLQIEEASLEHMWKARKNFKVTRLMVGLSWKKEV